MSNLSDKIKNSPRRHAQVGDSTFWLSPDGAEFIERTAALPESQYGEFIAAGGVLATMTYDDSKVTRVVPLNPVPKGTMAGMARQIEEARWLEANPASRAKVVVAAPASNYASVEQVEAQMRGAHVEIVDGVVVTPTMLYPALIHAIEMYAPLLHSRAIGRKHPCCVRGCGEAATIAVLAVPSVSFACAKHATHGRKTAVVPSRIPATLTGIAPALRLLPEQDSVVVMGTTVTIKDTPGSGMAVTAYPQPDGNTRFEQGGEPVKPGRKAVPSIR
jgi:hypothetical protein